MLYIINIKKNIESPVVLQFIRGKLLERMTNYSIRKLIVIDTI